MNRSVVRFTRRLRGIYALLTYAIALLLMCVPTPVSVSMGHSIQLGLEDGSQTSATFSGQPIKAIITLSDSTLFSDIAWHLGAGQYRHPDIQPGQKIVSAEVDLFWTSIPSYRDTAKKLSYDSIYVSLAGETIRSNRVVVYVTNLPPVIDSVKIGAIVDKLDDTIRYSLLSTDTTTHLTMRVGAHDINRDTLAYDWYSSRLAASLDPLQQVVYVLPQAQFLDTVTATVYDGKGGSSFKTILLSKAVQNRPPSIDSLAIDSLVVPGSQTSAIRFVAPALDSLVFRVHTSDPDVGDKVTVTWTNTNAKLDTIRSVRGDTQMVWKGDASLKTRLARDSVRVADTVIVVARDTRGDSTRRLVQIVQGRVNHPPRIDSVRVNNATTLAGTMVLFVDSISVRDSVRIKPFFSDPDSDSISWTYKVTRPLQYKKMADSSFLYVSKDSLLSDTMVFTVKDELGDSAKKSVIFATTNRYPVVDSMAVGDTGVTGRTVFKGNDSLFVRKDTFFVNDSVRFQLFAHDPDNGDTFSIQWSTASGKKMAAQDAKGFVEAYPCADVANRNDTVHVTVRDTKQKISTGAVVLHTKFQKRDHPPTIDSVRVDSAMVLRSGAAVFADSASGRDTIRLRVFASDPDSGDTAKWSARASRQTQLSVSKDTIMYICKDSLYRDTITLTARDLYNDSVRKQVVVNVVNRYPIIDSIVVRDTSGATGQTFKTPDSTSIVADTAFLKDTLIIHVYAHDPDAGDSIALSWSSAMVPVTVKDSKGLLVSCVCTDSLLFKDTLTVRVWDKKQKTVARSVVLRVKNVHRIIHTPPALDSLRINGTTHVSFAGTAVYSDTMVSGKDVLSLRLYSSDPSSTDSVKTQAVAKMAGQLTKKSDTLYQYLAKDSLYTDTIVFTAKDMNSDSVKKSFAVKVTDRLPVIDSILVKDTVRSLDTMYKAADSTYVARDTARGTTR